jgi:hypothetical protein
MSCPPGLSRRHRLTMRTKRRIGGAHPALRAAPFRGTPIRGISCLLVPGATCPGTVAPWRQATAMAAGVALMYNLNADIVDAGELLFLFIPRLLCSWLTLCCGSGNSLSHPESLSSILTPFSHFVELNSK